MAIVLFRVDSQASALVEELRSLCADLRERLTRARETQSRLAAALVAEVA